MSEAIAYPFLRPLAATISAEAWQYQDEDGRKDLGDVLPHWDYTVGLILIRKLRLYPGKLLEECALSDRANVMISVEMTTGDVGVRRCLWKKNVLLEFEQDVLEEQICLEISGQELQGQIELATSVSLINGRPHSSLAPSIAGSRLWGDRFVCQLEGGGGRLPMNASDFTALDQRLARAPWIFHLETAELDASFLGHFQVRLNSHRSDVVGAISKSDPMILERITHELVHHLLSQVMDWDEFTGESEDYDSESIGWTAAQWLSQAFPEEDISEIQAMRRQAPAKFRAILSSTFGGHYDA